MRTLTILLLSMLVAMPAFAGSRATSVAQQSQTQAQSQVQAQNQDQYQHQTAIAAPTQSQSLAETNTFSPSVGVQVEKTDPVINNSFNTKTYRPYRGLPYADAPINQQAPTLLYQPDKDTGPLFVGARKLVQLLNAAPMAIREDDDNIKIVVQPLATVASTTIEDDGCEVTFDIIKEKTKINSPVAFVSVIAEDFVTSVGLAAELRKVARKYNAHRVVFIKEGVQIQMRTTGKSFGINPSVSMSGGMGVGSSMGAVGAGGMGIASATGEYIKLPYLQAILLP